MNQDDFNTEETERIESEAADWFGRMDAGLSSEESEAYQAWLDSDPRHAQRMERFQDIWTRFEPIAEERDSVAEKQSPPERIFPLWRVAAGIAAVLALGIFLGLGGWNGAAQEDRISYEQRFIANAYETRILADGTILELNEGARLMARFTAGARSVWLHEGEAHFHVAKDPERPFVVHAGDTQVKAIGTAFNVRVQDRDVAVLVTEGRIRFSNSLSNSSSVNGNAFSSDMEAGQMSIARSDLGATTPEIETVAKNEISRILSWKPETLEFRSAPLGDVINAFNKRNEIQLVLGDETLETMPIEATFRASNVSAFARLLELSFDLEARQTDDNRIVLSLRD